MKKLLNPIFFCSILFIIGAIIGLFITYITNSFDNKTFIIKNNSTRDYNYEHYCDSIYLIDKDYYFDVLIETDKFNDYINKHRQWWTN